jgi:hypothetical protein
MNSQTTTQFDLESMYDSFNHYESYYKGKRTPRQRYVILQAIQRFVESNDLQNPNQYLLYLIADKGLSAISSKSEQYMITELEEELQKDISLFN